jgi:putative addiction module killer protein
MVEYTIANYIDNDGKEPIKDWFKSLDGTTRKRILLRFDRLKDGNFGDYKQLNEYLYELRFNFGSGYRVYYTFENNTIVLLINGGDKKSQVKDIKKAQEIIKNLKGL